MSYSLWRHPSNVMCMHTWKKWNRTFAKLIKTDNLPWFWLEIYKVHHIRNVWVVMWTKVRKSKGMSCPGESMPSTATRMPVFSEYPQPPHDYPYYVSLSGNAEMELNHWFWGPCDLEIEQMTLKNNRAPLLCYFKLCAAFHSHWWI